tara:strand:+ start:1128 stop:1388 length:261 start_codon:yes stop_codon:yes gene_type:complete
MKLTKQQLKQIIKEELETVLSEDTFSAQELPPELLDIAARMTLQNMPEMGVRRKTLMIRVLERALELLGPEAVRPSQDVPEEEELV